MELKQIFSEILSIASQIEYKTLTYRHSGLVAAKKKKNPADLLGEIAAIFESEIKYGLAPDKKKIKTAISELKAIAKEYQIEELRNPVKNLESYLNGLD